MSKADVKCMLSLTVAKVEVSHIPITSKRLFQSISVSEVIMFYSQSVSSQHSKSRETEHDP